MSSMARFSSVDQLLAVKSELGPLHFLDFETKSLADAHRLLGEDVAEQVHRILRKKLSKLSDAQLLERIRLARRCRQELGKKSQDTRIEAAVRDAIVEYLSCISAWGLGAQLDKLQYQWPNDSAVDGVPISAVDLALVLQDDDVGCETGVIRQENGTVIMWHTEEDADEDGFRRFDKLRVATFHFWNSGQLEQLSAFVYPHLLPGPAFGWRNNVFVQAMDSLYIKRDIHNGNVFANVACWIALRLGTTSDLRSIVTSLGPFFDGCALLTVSRHAKKVFAGKVEFAGSQMSSMELDEVIGDFLVQVNLFSDRNSVIARTYEDVDSGLREVFERRIHYTERIMRLCPAVDNDVQNLVRLLASRLGGNAAYANKDVKSYLLSRISAHKLEIWIGAGPALKGDLPHVLVLADG